MGILSTQETLRACDAAADAARILYARVEQFHKLIGSPVVLCTAEDRRKQFNEYISALVNELSEVQAHVEWKPWKPLSAQEVDKFELAKELFDILVFVTAIGELYGISPDLWANAVRDKMTELHVRAQKGYYVPSTDDSQV